MTSLRKIGRLFTINTRLEAYHVTYAIAVGAVERGVHYMANYPGNGGIVLALACLGVPFIAGAKLLDSVREPSSIPATVQRVMPPRRRGGRLSISRNRPKSRRSVTGSASPNSHHTD